MTEVRGGQVRSRPRLGCMPNITLSQPCTADLFLNNGNNNNEWFEGGLGQQRNDGGGTAPMREREESVERPGAYVTE